MKAGKGVNPRPTSSGLAPAETLERQRGAHSRMARFNLCVTACALPGSVFAVCAKEMKT